MENIREIFYDVNEEQRCAIINLLLGVSGYEREHTIEQMNYLNQQVDILEVSSQKSMYYLKKDGANGIIRNLRILDDSQKRIAVLMLWKITTLHGKPSKNLAMHMFQMLQEIGVSPEFLNETLANSKMF